MLDLASSRLARVASLAHLVVIFDFWVSEHEEFIKVCQQPVLLLGTGKVNDLLGLDFGTVRLDLPIYAEIFHSPLDDWVCAERKRC